MKKFLPVSGRTSGFLFLTFFLFLNVYLGVAQSETPVGSELASDEGITIITDKDDYAPLSNAVFSGSGFEPFEVVVLRVKNLTQPCNTTHSDQSYAPFSVTTDENGAFVTNWTVCNCPGDSLRLKVVGQTTGKIGYAYFTDSKLQNLSFVSPSGNSVTVTQGATAQFYTKTTFNGQNSNCTITFGSTLSPTITSWTNGNSETSINKADINKTFNINTSTLVPGNYNFTISATPNSNCESNNGQGYKDETASGTLIVTASSCTTPAPPTSGGNQTVCSSSPIQTLTATATPPAGATVVWFENASGGTSVTPTLNQIGSKTYYAESRVGTTCFSTSRTPVTLTINETPSASLSPNNVNICQGESVTLNVSLAGSGTISGTLTGGISFSGAAGTTVDVVVAPASSTTYTITSLTDGTCSGTGVGTTNVNILGKYTADAGTDQTICPTATAAISGSVTGSPSTTLWTTSGTGTFDDAGALSTTYNPSAADVTAGSVTLTLTASGIGACDGSDDLLLTLEDVTAPTAIAQDVTVLLSEGGTLTAAEFDNGSSDLCGEVTLAISQETFTCTDLGANTVTLTVTDESNNVSTTTATVTVVDDVAPTAIAQDVTVLLSEGGTLTAAEFDNGSSDLCGEVTLAISQETFTCADLGANTVTLTVTDESNNVSTTTATVTVVDDVAPTAIAQDVTVLLSEGGTLTAAEFDNGSSDLCGEVTLAISQETFTCADLGANTVTLTLTDESNNVSTTTATVTVVDDVAPTAIAQDVTVLLSEGGTLTAAEFDNGSSDLCGEVTLAISQETFTCADLGANTVTLTVTDESNNVSTTTATVTVVDDVAPTAIAQDVTVLLSEGGTLTAAEFDNGSSDLCGEVTLAISQETFTCADLGANTVTLTVTDESNNVSTTTATVTVVDDVAPTAIAQDVTVLLSEGGTLTAAEFDNGSSDLCGEVTLAISQETFTCADLGANTVTLTVTDESNNVSTTTATVTVVDDVAPTAIAQDVTVLLSEGGTLTAAEFDNGSSDLCGEVTLAISQETFTCADLGANTVTLTVTDESNNVSTTTATVTVVDDVAPTAIAQDVTVLLSEGGTLTAAEFDNGSSDLCGEVTLAISQETFTCTDLGANTVTLTLTDESNNVSTTTATVTVVDDVAPTAIAQDVTVLLSEGGTLTAAEFDNGSSDLCGEVTLAISQETFTCADLGANTVTLTVTDESNNVSTTTATVTVVDDVAPTAIAQDVTVLLSEGGTLTAAEFDNGSSDLCGEVTLAISQETFTCTDLGANTVTLTVTDESNNVSTTTATVTVVDDVAPTAIAQDVTVLLSEGGTLTAAEFDNGSSDLCGEVTLAISQETFTCTDLGANTVTLTVTDESNNVSTTTATVTVVDDVAPTAIAQDVTVLLSEGGTLTAAEFDNGSSDLCGEVTLAISQETFTCADLGANTVTLTVTDESNNVSTTTATVTVVDDVAPTAIAQDVTVLLSEGGTLTAAEFDNGSSDLCGEVTLAISQETFTCTDLGANTVTLTVTDESNNVSTTTATVTVVDDVAPTAIAQDVTVLLSEGGTLTAAEFDNGSSDLCGEVTLAISQETFTCADLGANTVTLTVTDESNNVSTTTATVTVVDDVAPTAIAQDVTVLLSEGGTLTAAEFDNGSSDLCGEVTLAISQETFTCADLGANTVTLTVTDESNNVSTTTATVTVVDDVAPTAIAQDVTVLLSEGGTLTAAEFDNGSSDLCGEVTLAISQETFTCADLGANTVTLTVTDESNNVSTTTATVTVVDDVAPTAIAQDVTVLLSEGGTLTAAEFDNGSSDLCGEVTLAISQETFTCADLGANTVTLTVTDESNNVSTTTATVTVVDDVAPTAIAQDVTVLLSEGGTLTAAEFDNGSSDLCGEVTLAISQETFTCADLGANTVTLTVTDESNNVSTTTATVTVVDDVAPTAIAQDVTVLLSEGGTLTAAEFDNGSSDLCGEVTLAISQETFTCTDLGANTVTLTVTDESNNVSTTTATVTVVDDVAPEITCVENKTRTNDPGTCTYTVIAIEFDPTFDDNCSGATVSNDYNNLASLSGAIFEEGNTTVEWTVTDASGNEMTCSFTVTVTNEAPIIRNISGPIDPVQVNTGGVELTATYTDNNVTSATWTLITNDGVVDQYTCEECVDNGIITGSFNPQPGVYTVELEVTDACGAVDTFVYEYIVIFDPSGGFVTGGGWIDSPVGAMQGNYASVTGKANFGFNAKYKNGKNNITEVDGHTNFQFKSGDLHFSSKGHDDMSLVIAGKKATYTGYGTINGSGNHKFRVIAIDGDANGGNDPDEFRIKIWGSNSNSEVIYDNQRGESESSDLATVLGGGSIVIHKPKGGGKTKTMEDTSVAIQEKMEVETEPIEILNHLEIAPNPVTAYADIRFSLKERLKADLRIYDLNGKLIKSLYSGVVNADQVIEVGFERENLMSGIYICKLLTGDGRSYEKQIVIK